MVIGKSKNLRRKNGGMLTTELVIAMGILAAVLIPLSFSFVNEQKLCRAYYQKAVLMEILDGEMEVLVAGESQNFGEGKKEISVRALSVKNLPEGKFFLTKTGNRLRLEWIPEKKTNAKPVAREAMLK